VCAQPGVLCADNVSWANTGGGVYSSGGNWIGGSMPGSTDTAVFNTGDNTYGVTFSSTAVSHGFVIRSDQVSFSLGLMSYNLNHQVSADDYVVIGREAGDTGLFTIASGAINNTTNVGTVILGRNAGALGVVNFSGSARWNIACNTWIGNNGTGIFNQLGGSVTFNQTDVPTRLHVGFNAHGSYNLSGGALNSVPALNFITGIGVNSHGTFNQTGGSHSTDMLHLGIGSTGVGRYILGGGSLVTAQTLIGAGVGGSGAFQHTAGHHSSTGSIDLGSAGGSDGSYLLSGTGSVNAAALRIYKGGEYTQNNGSFAAIDHVTMGGGPAAGTASAALSGGSFTSPLLTVGASSHFTQTGGTLNVTVLELAGGVATFGGGVVATGGTTSISNNSTYNITGLGTRIFNTRILDNDGVIVHSTSTLQLQNAAQIVNAGELRLNSEAGVVAAGNGGLIINTGRLSKAAGIGTSSIGAGVTLVNNGGSVDVQSGSLAVSGFLSVGVGTMAKDGPGAFVVTTGSQAWDSSSAFRVNDGTAIFPKGLNPGGANSDRPTLKVNVATAVLNEQSFLRTASINTPGTIVLQPGGDAVMVSHTLDIDVGDGARLDINDNTIIVDYDIASPLETVIGYLASGYSSGAWTGAGIMSGVAALDPARAVGVTESVDIGVPTFAGVSVDDTAVLVSFTYYGDTDLDGDVDVDDLGAMATNWQQPASWADGDMDYSGTVDVNDLGLFAGNWQAGVEPGPGPSFAEAAASLGLPAHVPEPSFPAALGAHALAFMRLRARRTHNA
jgi:hypothetical protein